MSDNRRLYVANGLITIRLVPELAVEIGLPESAVLLQTDYLLSIKGEVLDDTGIRWVRQSIRDMQSKFFPFWSTATIGRTLSDLVERGYLITRSAAEPSDTTLWYAYGPECDNLVSAKLINSELSYSGKPSPKKKPTKPGEAKDPSIYDLAVALASVCKIDFNMNKGRMLKEAKELAGKTPDQILQLFGPNSPWYHYDFRGKQGSPPAPSQVKLTWDQMESHKPMANTRIRAEDGGLNI